MTRIGLTYHALDALLIASTEVRVLEDENACVLKPCLLEVVHVKLTQERGEIAVLKVLGKYLAEFLLVFDDKASTVGCPADDFLEVLALKHGEHFCEERRWAFMVILFRHYGLRCEFNI